MTRWKKWRVKMLLGPLAWLHCTFGPPLNSHLIILSDPTFLSLVNNDPFLLPSFFSLLQIVTALEIAWPVCSSNHFLSWPWLQLYAWYSQLIQAKHRVESQHMCSLGLLTNISFLFRQKWYSPEGKFCTTDRRRCTTPSPLWDSLILI